MILGAFAFVVSGQQVLPAVQVSTTPNQGDRNGEPVIVASPRAPGEVLVAWNAINDAADYFRIHYRVVQTGFQDPLPPSPSVLPLPNAVNGTCGTCSLTRAQDPCVTVSRAVLPGTGQMTGDLFLGALCFRTTLEVGRTLGLARKRLGDADLELLVPGTPKVSYAAACATADSRYDRPSLAAGPPPPGLPTYGAPEAMYFTFQYPHMESNRSLPAATLGSAWECDPQNECDGYPATITSGPGGAAQFGLGNPGVVVHSGPRAGRLLVASAFTGIGGITDLPPEVRWSDVGGGPPSCSATAPWALGRRLDRYGPADDVVAGVDIDPNPFLFQVPVPQGISHLFKSAPGIAVDPNDPSNVYVVFSGRAVNDTPDQIDLFMAWTNTGNVLPPSLGGTGPLFQSATSQPQVPWSQTTRT